MASRVSILVLVEVLPWAQQSTNLFCQPFRFQSLFWWKYCPGGKSTAIKALLPSFNPCSGGSIALGSYSGSIPRIVIGFNPCSGGSIALGWSEGKGKLEGLKFQSLFWWKYCPGSLTFCGVGKAHLVSILVLVEVLPWEMQGMSQEGVIRNSFNPCSGGSIALGGRRAAPRARAIFVSILVLVEVLPWELDGLLRIIAHHEFQSLFWWKYCPGP